MSLLLEALSNYVTYFKSLTSFFLLIVILLFCTIGFVWRNNKYQLTVLMGKENTLIDSRFWYTPSDVRNYFTHITATSSRYALNLYALTQVTLDVVFPIAYGTLFAAEIVFLYEESFSQILILIPTSAVVADLGENFLITILALSYPYVISPLTWLSSIFTSIKWFMIISSLITLLVGIIL